MAERPIFIPWIEGSRLVKEVSVSFVWNPGLAITQKRKNIDALHKAAALKQIFPVLECSTKSDNALGSRLSAFNLKVGTAAYGELTLECAFQGSKVFENGGPYEDLYRQTSRAAKGDERLKRSGGLVAFSFEGHRYPLMPKTAFYDWLFIRSLYPHREYLRRLDRYAAFSDIEFNPERSINCQARSTAIFVALERKGLLEQCHSSFRFFSDILAPDAIVQPHSQNEAQGSLF
jgi:hypothetical protein